MRQRLERKSKRCTVVGCRRPSRARGMCQSHYKHLGKYGEPRRIRNKRQGRKGTTKFGGFSVTPGCAEALTDSARRLGRTPNYVITDVLELWAKRAQRL